MNIYEKIDAACFVLDRNKKKRAPIRVTVTRKYLMGRPPSLQNLRRRALARRVRDALKTTRRGVRYRLHPIVFVAKPT